MDRLCEADLQQLGQMAMTAECHELPDLVQAAYMRGYRAGLRMSSGPTQRPTATSSLQEIARRNAERQFEAISRSA